MLDRRHFLTGAGAIGLGGLAFDAVAARSSAGTVVGRYMRRQALQDGYFPITHFGIRGDGSDETASLQAAIAQGVPIDGGKRPFGIGHALTLVDGSKLRNLSFKQMAPGDAARILDAAGKSRITLQNIALHVGDNPAAGALTRSTNVQHVASARADGLGSGRAGLSIRGGAGHLLQNVSVTGKGRGLGIALIGCTDSTFVDLLAHDLVYSNPDALDDMLAGIFLGNLQRCVVTRPKASNLTGDARYDRSDGNGHPVPGRAPSRRYTRGIACSGCSDTTIEAPRISFVDEALDLSGTSGNHRVIVRGGLISMAYTWGYKNTSNGSSCLVQGLTCSDCGTCFTVSAPDSRVVGCTAVNPGSAATLEGNKGVTNPISGFRSGATRGNLSVVFENCVARDTQANHTMVYGFYNEDIASPGTTIQVQAVNCRAFGYTGAAFQGVQTMNRAAG